MDHRLPDKRSAAHTIRQTVPLSGQAEPDRPLTRAPSRSRPALGASSNVGVRDSGARSKQRKDWPEWIREGGTRFLIRRSRRRTWDAVGEGPCPQGDRTQISEAPQAVESLRKCTLRGAAFPFRTKWCQIPRGQVEEPGSPTKCLRPRSFDRGLCCGDQSPRRVLGRDQMRL